MIRFSIVIPTRERHETLGSTLQTVLTQDFDDYEIVVSDNFSSPETKLVVDSFNSDKIKYFLSGWSRYWYDILRHSKLFEMFLLSDLLFVSISYLFDITIKLKRGLC